MPLSAFEKLALRWVPGEGPVEIHRLASGLVNDSFRVARAGRQYSLRIANARSADQGFDREWECKVLGCAAAAGLAPAIEHCDPAGGVLVAEWVSGRAWSPQEIQQPETIEAMARLLRQMHALPIPQPARIMNPAAWIAHYSQALARVESDLPAVERRATVAAAALREAADASLALLGVSPAAAPVLCHSDLHRHNVMVREPGAGIRVLLLDWEYAHVSDPYWDLAGWAANNELQHTPDLLSSYLGRKATATESARLALFEWLYDYVCLLWSDLYLARRPGAAQGAAQGPSHGVAEGAVRRAPEAVAHDAAAGGARAAAEGAAHEAADCLAHGVAKRAEQLRVRLLARMG